MNRKLSGKKLLPTLVVAVAMLATLACTKDISGNPKKVLSDYISAVQKGDFETIFAFNALTARQKKYLEKSEGEGAQTAIQQRYNEHLADYRALTSDAFTGVRWTEKLYFPASAEVALGEPRHPPAVGDDPVNAAYERGLKVLITTTVSYRDSNDSPALEGKKIKHADYDCTLSKIRHGDNVRIYSHDENWFFAGCIIARESVEFFQ